jgi:transposase
MDPAVTPLRTHYVIFWPCGQSEDNRGVPNMKTIEIIGIDLAKSNFHCHIMFHEQKSAERKKFNRTKLMSFVQNLQPCIIAMEACGGSHFWARTFISFGHDIRLIAPSFVKPFVKSNKNDWADAEAIAEAALRPTMRFVAVKGDWQQDIEAIHRRRERLVRNRVALTNSLRGLLHERGVVIAQGSTKFLSKLEIIIEENGSKFSCLMLEEIREAQVELKELEAKISEINNKIESYAKSNEKCQSLLKVNGVGVLTATAVIAAIGDPKNFKNGRQFAAWVGLVPKHSGTGGKNVNFGISKRGDPYLRKLLIHGGRSIIRRTPQDCQSSDKYFWVAKLRSRIGSNKTAVAIANKNARIIWAMLAKGVEFDSKIWGSNGVTAA